MENKEQHDLSEAIKQTYRVSPLKTDLSATVKRKVLAGRPAAPIAFTDKMLQLLLFIIAGSTALFILYYLFNAASFAVLLTAGIFIGAYLWISLREINYYKSGGLQNASLYPE